MIEYKYLSNVKRITLGFGKTDELNKDDIKNFVLQKYKQLGINIEGQNVRLFLIIDEVWFSFDEALLLSNENIVVLLSDVVAPKCAVNYDYYEGIRYYFHTDEQKHEHNPHIHAKYDNEEISVYLNDFHIAGKMSNTSKQNQAIKYVRRNHQAILQKWNNLMGNQI